jgi:RNA polymerase sigma factor (sigma-70 family)
LVGIPARMPTNKGSGRHASVLLDSTARNSKNRTESKIIEQVRRGSASALEQLMDLYERRLLRLAPRLTSSYEDAEEVVQTAFLKAFYNLNSFRGDSSFYTWIVRIARNEALMKIRRRRPEFVSIDDHDLKNPKLLQKRWKPRRLVLRNITPCLNFVASSSMAWVNSRPETVWFSNFTTSKSSRATKLHGL